MLLTSYERLRRYLVASGENLLTDNANNRRDLIFWMKSISDKIERYLNRELYIEARTEYFDLRSMTEFWVKAFPIISITSVKVDSTGLFNGGESTLNSTDAYYIGSDSNTMVLESPESWEGKRGIQIVYTGGVAYHGSQSIFAVTPSALWTVGNFCSGNTSFAIGIVRSASLTSMTIEVLYGVFETGETLTEYSDEGTTATAKTATLNSKTQTSLAEAYPDIVMATEMEIRYLRKHKHDFENTGTTQDGTTVRRDGIAYRRLPLQPEVIDLLDPYRKVAFV